MLQDTLHKIDGGNMLLGIDNGYDLIYFLQNVKRGESYPDLIILGTGTSRLNGTELLELLKTDDIYRLIPVLMLQDVADEKEAERCHQLGADTLLFPGQPTQWKEAAEKICTAFI
jgi:CheY-like chemotaxis protein